MKQGWVEKKLGDVCDIFNGATPLRGQKEYWEGGVINWFTVKDIRQQGRTINHTDQKISQLGFDNTSIKLLPARSVLLCCTASVGEYAITNIELTTNQQFNGLVVKNSDQLLPEYLFHFSSTLKSILLSVSGKTTIDFVSMTKLKNVEISIPPLEEQKQIVAKLDQCFEAIDKARANAVKNLENAKELFQSKLNDIFSQKGEGWVEKKLGDVCSLIKRGIPPKYIETGGIQVVNQKCIRNHKVNLTLARRHNIVLKSVSQEKLIQIGDVLVNSTGVGTLGRVAQVRDSIISDTTVDTHVTIVRPIPDLFFIDFFGYVLIKIEDEITKSGEGASGQTELARTKLQNNFIVSYPTSLEEQKQIVKILDSLKKQTQSLESKYQQELNSLEELKKSILQKAFEGEL